MARSSAPSRSPACQARSQRPFTLFALLCLLLTPAPSFAQLATTPHVTVREFRFEGHTVFTSAQLAAVVAPFTGREITRSELEDARRAVTLHYVTAGYLNSGALIPDQPVTDTITIRIVEGRLTETTITSNHWLRTGYLRDRIQPGTPLNIHRLRDQLQILRVNPNVVQLNAELQPGNVPGESRLHLHVRDRQPFRVGLQVDNERPPSVGAYQVLARLADLNLTGHSDALEINYGIVSGGQGGWDADPGNNVEASYQIPITPHDTTVRLFGDRHNYAIIEEPFAALGIESESYRLGAQIRHPLYRTANRELAVSASVERRHSETELLGIPFPITPGSVNGEINLYVLRLAQEWTDRGAQHVFAVRSTINLGLDLGDATDDGTDRDAQFVSWLGQAQYVRRLFGTPTLLVLRTDLQWTEDRLLAPEQFSLGGSQRGRGYREDQLLRDRGVFASAEVRFPLLARRSGEPLLQIGPFVDFGAGWNRDISPRPRTIGSAGGGLIFTPERRLAAQLYWGYAFRDFDTNEEDAQDLGLHFRVSADLF